MLGSVLTLNISFEWTQVLLLQMIFDTHLHCVAAVGHPQAPQTPAEWQLHSVLVLGFVQLTGEHKGLPVIEECCS